MRRPFVVRLLVPMLAAAPALSAQTPPPAQLARPTPAQHAYQELERIMFIHFHPGTWSGREYDDGKTDLSTLHPSKLDVDQWCEAAKSWDAKMILYVAKHCGGFCWWQTDTTEYSVKNTPYKGGRGDVMQELSDACRRHGLKFGVYIYPGDPAWGAGIGSGGRTADPSRQDAYNRVFRKQLEEVWTRYGEVAEAWFDGSCVIPIDDLVKEHLEGAVIFQSPQASIRWVGNERGLAPYPAWNSLASSDLHSGVATARHGDPDGDAWAPLECDVPLYDHAWLWSPQKEQLRRSLHDLLNIYYKSVGRGAVMLLNASPNTDGLIPTGDMARYRELGAELERRFANPLGRASGTGSVHTVRFDAPTTLNQVVFMEDYRQGERIRRYVLEVREPSGTWRTVNEGTSVGRKRIVMFEPVTATQVSLRVTESVGEPLVKAMTVHFVDGENAFLYEPPPLADAVSQGAHATASDVHSARFSADRVCDGNTSTRWATGSKWGTPAAMKPPFAAWIELDLGAVKTVDSTTVVEGWDRSQRFQLEYRADPARPWQVALVGTTLGADYAQGFPAAAGRYWRLNILESKDEPTIWEWQLFSPREVDAWRRCASVTADRFEDGVAELEVDLRPFITQPGQFLLRVDDLGAGACAVERLTLLYNGREVVEGMLSAIAPGALYNINRTAAVVERSEITLQMALRTATPSTAHVELSIQRSF